MAPSRSTKPGRTSLKDELSDLLGSGTKPKDFDPEALDHSDSDDASDAGSDAPSGSDAEAEDKGREHYVAVGASKLRARIADQAGPEALGKQYVGKRVKRGEIFGSDGEQEDDDDESEEENEEEDQRSEEADTDSENEEDDEGLPFEELEGLVGQEGSDEEIDSDAAFGESDIDKEYTKFKFRGSKTTKGGMPPKKGAKVAGSSEEESEDEAEDDEDDNILSGLEDGVDGDDDESEDDDVEDDEDEDLDEDEEVDDNDEDNEVAESDSGSEDSDSAPTNLQKALATDSARAISASSATPITDLEKGNAVRGQQATFDGFLGGRVKLQKALIATNDLALLEEDGKLTDADKEGTETWEEVEEAAVKLWNAIAEMRMVSLTHPKGFYLSTGYSVLQLTLPPQDILPPTYSNSKKRKAPEITADTPLPTITTHMNALHTTARPFRATNINKWTSQTQANTTDPLFSHRTKKLDTTVRTVPTSISGLPPHLDQYIHPPGSPTQIQPRLISRSHIPRFCAPNHAARAIATCTSIYDDSEFYTLLLNTLITQRNANASYAPALVAVQAKKALKASDGVKMRLDKETGQMVKVDTKASKGRRLRYGVHEKLMDFMPSISEKALGWWEERQVEELFGSLLGQTRTAAGGDDSDMEVDGLEGEEDGLRVFG